MSRNTVSMLADSDCMTGAISAVLSDVAAPPVPVSPIDVQEQTRQASPMIRSRLTNLLGASG
ncbi:MAG: hypothetical protein CMD83_02320 [Gammaproteobacteria bacterium]|nr:hypothetical protein [Gammaproteobacteria bacterium]